MDRVKSFREIVGRLIPGPVPPLNMAEVVRSVVLPAPSGKMESARILHDPFKHADGSRECRPVFDPPAFDHRPGAIGLRQAEDVNGAIVAVGARHDGDGWQVQLLRHGEVIALLSGEAAEALAKDLNEMAAVIGGRRW